MKKYDFIFGIGRACACSQSLRKAGLQLLSLPWDWLATTPTPDGPDLDMRLKIMESGFADWLREEDRISKVVSAFPALQLPGTHLYDQMFIAGWAIYMFFVLRYLALLRPETGDEADEEMK